MFRFSNSIREWRPLQLSVLGTALPILVFSIVMVLLFDRQQQKSIEQMLRQSAQSAMAAVDRELADHVGTLEALAVSPQLEDGDLAGFYSHAKRILDSRAEWLTMRLSDARTHRQIINLLTPLGEALPSVLDPEQIDAVVRSRQPLIGGIRPAGDLDAEPFVILRVPVMRDGAVIYTLSASVRASAFSRILINDGIPDDWTAAVVDQKGHIVARNVGQDRFVGEPAPLPRPWARAAESDGLSFTESSEGEPLYAAFSRSRFSSWTVAIGVPARAVEGPQRRSLLVVGSGGVIALLLALTLARVLARNLVGRQAAERGLAVMRAEQSAERRLADIAANFPGLIYRAVLHRDGRLSYPYISERVERLIGMRPEALRRKVLLAESGRRWVDPEDLARWQRTILDSARTLSAYHLEYRVREPGGGVRWVRSMAHARREADGATVWDGVMLDISDLKETEFALRDSDERLRLAVEATALGTWDWSLRDGVVTCSDRTKRFLGLPLEAEVRYRPFLARVQAEDRRRTHRVLKGALDPNGNAELDIEFRVTMPDGAVRWIAARGSAMFGDDPRDRRAVRVIGTVRDITGRKAAEAALAAALAEKDSLLQQKDMLFREVHHRVKNNLQVISSLVSLEALQVADEDARERMARIRHRIVILGAIHEQLYRSDNFTRVEIGARLTDICRGLERLYQNDAVAIDVETDRLFCSIETAIPLGLITNELVSNCFKHGFRNGRSGRVRVSFRRTDADEIRLVVADNGPGLPDQPERRATGLGFQVVSTLAKQIGAKISFENELGGGGSGARITLVMAGDLCER